MKKLLLCMVAIVAAINLSAKDDDEGMGKWQALFEPVAAADDMGNIQMAQGGEGSVYVSSKCSKAFTFGITSVAPEISGSSVIVKYDGEGNQQGAMTFEGAVDITAMTADADGNLYAAGCFLEGMTITDAFGTQTVVAGNETNYCAFIVKVSAQGLLAALRVLQPTPDTDVTENYEAGYFYYPIDPLTITPNKIQLDGDKVYVSAKYYGNVEDLGWKGAYAQSWGMAFDVASYGVFSLSKSDLKTPKSEANFRQTDVAEGVTEAMCEPEAFSFVVSNGIVSIAAFCYGDVTLSTPIGNKNFSYARATDESGKKTHALVMVSIAGTLLVKEYPSAVMHANEALGLYGIMGIEVDGTTAYLGGTCYGSFPLDAETSYDHTYAFLSAFDMTSGNMLWASGMPYESRGITMIVTDDEIHAVTTLGTAIFDLSSQEVELDDEMKLDAAASYGDSYVSVAMVNETYVGVIAIDMDGDNGGGGDDGRVTFGYWEKRIEPLSDDQAGDLKGLHTAVALDGSVYASMTYNKDIEFAGKAVPSTDGLLSSLIVKYDNEGKEQWSASIIGAVVVTAMTTDPDGNLYVAGEGQGAITTIATDGSKVANLDEEVKTAFVAKFSPDGKVLEGTTFKPVADPDLLETGLYYPEGLYVTPNTIKVFGDKVYVAASYNGNVDELGWKAAYQDVFGWMYMESRSKGIFSLNSKDLSNPQSVMTVQNSERVSENQYFPEALNFGISNKGQVQYGFIGFGNLTVTTPSGAKDFSFEMTDDGSGNKEHAFVIGYADDPENCYVYHADKHDRETPGYDITTMMANGKAVLVAGTFYGNLWFWRETTQNFKAGFMALTELGTDYTNTVWGESEGEGTACSLEGGNVILSLSDEGTILIDSDGAKTLTEKVADEIASYHTAANGYIFHDGAKVFVCGRYNAEEAEKIATEIKPVAPAVQKKSVRYNLAGQQVNESYKGIVIENGVKKLAK